MSYKTIIKPYSNETTKTELYLEAPNSISHKIKSIKMSRLNNKLDTKLIQNVNNGNFNTFILSKIHNKKTCKYIFGIRIFTGQFQLLFYSLSS